MCQCTIFCCNLHQQGKKMIFKLSFTKKTHNHLKSKFIFIIKKIRRVEDRNFINLHTFLPPNNQELSRQNFKFKIGIRLSLYSY